MAEVQEKKKRAVPVKLIWIFIILAAGIVASGFFLYRGYERQYRAQVEQELSAVADLKTAELVQWRMDRLGDAEIIYNNAALPELVRRYFINPEDREAARQLRQFMALYPKHYNYDQIRLFDSRGATRMSSPPGRPPASAAVRRRVPEVIKSGRIAIVDFYRHDHDRRVYLSVLVPILDPSARNRAIGAISLRADPEKYLYPLMSRWLTSSRTAETLLVRREGNAALFLNELKSAKGSALNLRTPLERTEDPAVKAVLGRTGIVDGIDYRGAEVIADVRSVPGSPWFIVARIDKSEALAPVGERLWMLSGLVAALVFGAGAGLAFAWRRQSLVFYQKWAEALRESEARYRALFEQSAAPIMLTDLGGAFVAFNTAAHEYLDYTREEFARLNVADVDAIETREETARHIRKVIKEGADTFETVHRTKNGELRNVLVSVSLISVSGKKFIQSVMRDFTDRKRAEEKLQASELWLQSIYNSLDEAVLVVTTDRKFLNVNRAAESMFGYSEEELRTISAEILHVDREHYEEFGRRIQEAFENNRVAEFEFEARRKNGEVFPTEHTVSLLKNMNGDTVGIVNVVRDFTERKRAEDELRRKQAMLARTEGIAHVGSWEWDASTGAVTWSDELFSIFKLDPAAGAPFFEEQSRIFHAEDMARLRRAADAAVNEGVPYELELRAIRADGETRVCLARGYAEMGPRGKAKRLFGSLQDITERKRLEEAIIQLAHHDPLTGLPNRRLFREIIDHELAEARRNRRKVALLFLDLDRFKEINDTFGHETGDEVLKEVSKRLKGSIRESDAAARVGGDEFNIILADIARPQDVSHTSMKIMDSFKRPFTAAEHEFHVTASVGISIYPDDSDQTDTLYRYADIAMYHAKETGRNAVQFYNPGINIRSIERMRTENMLRRSIDLGQLAVYYQPQIDISNRRIVCAEALVRWNHPERGLLEAEQFISTAEDTDLITVIDEYVLRTACAQVKSWLDAGLPAACVTVNLSAREFRSPELINRISAILKSAGVPPECLIIEITESLAMSNIDRTIDRLTELSRMGVNAHIDDFGIGYSSLNYLKRLPIQKLKIDKSFTRDIAADADDRAIITAVTAMAHNMKMGVIVEGVETEEQLSFLRSTQCDEAQGYLFGKALPAEEFGLLLAESR